MRVDVDAVQFESQKELQELMKVISKYVATFPKEKNNEILKEFYFKLDIIEMNW